EPRHNFARPLCETILSPPLDPSPRLRLLRSRHPGWFEPWRDSARRLCDTTSPPPPDPSLRLRPCRSNDRVPSGTLRRLLLLRLHFLNRLLISLGLLCGQLND